MISEATLAGWLFNSGGPLVALRTGKPRSGGSSTARLPGLYDIAERAAAECDVKQT